MSYGEKTFRIYPTPPEPPPPPGLVIKEANLTHVSCDSTEPVDAAIAIRPGETLAEGSPARTPELAGGGDWALARRVVALLNDLLTLDRAAVSALIAARVPCNAALAGHPTVQVGSAPDGSGTVGLLGILNGICGTIPSGEKAGWGPICAKVQSWIITDGEEEPRNVVIASFCLATEAT